VRREQDIGGDRRRRRSSFGGKKGFLRRVSTSWWSDVRRRRLVVFGRGLSLFSRLRRNFRASVTPKLGESDLQQLV
jgi:hypothetical protein